MEKENCDGEEVYRIGEKALDGLFGLIMLLFFACLALFPICFVAYHFADIGKLGFENVLDAGGIIAHISFIGGVFLDALFLYWISKEPIVMAVGYIVKRMREKKSH